jgi:hypothetical protein
MLSASLGQFVASPRQIVACDLQVRVPRDGFFKPGNSKLWLLPKHVGGADVVGSQGIRRIQTQHMPPRFDRLVIIANVEIVEALRQVRRCVAGARSNLLLRAHGFDRLPVLVLRPLEIVARKLEIRCQPEGMLTRCNAQVVAHLHRVGDAKIIPRTNIAPVLGNQRAQQRDGVAGLLGTDIRKG